MAKQKQLIKQVVDKLRTDSGAADRLIELTKHRSNRIRIGRDMQPRKGNLPYLGVSIMSSIPINVSVTSVQIAAVRFSCYSTTELTAIDIADRIEVLLDDSSGSNRSFFDFSGSVAGEVRNKSTRFSSRDGIAFDDEKDVWSIFVYADIIWDSQI